MSQPVKRNEALIQMTFAGRDDPARLGADLLSLVLVLRDVAVAYEVTVLTTLERYASGDRARRTYFGSLRAGRIEKSHLQPEDRLRPQKVSYASPLELTVVIPSAVVLASAVPVIGRKAVDCFVDAIETIFRLPARLRVGRLQDQIAEKHLEKMLHDPEAVAVLAELHTRAADNPLRLLDIELDGKRRRNRGPVELDPRHDVDR
jgi:hypothetical protein